MSVTKKLDALKRILGAENFFLAEAFIDKNLKPLKIRKTSNLYVAAVEYIGTLIQEEKQILTDKEAEILAKDNTKKTVGTVHKKLKKEFENLVKLNQILEGEKKEPARTPSKPLPDPIPAAAAKKEPPEVTLEADQKRVQKGGSATVTWASKNAARISRTDIPGVTSRSPLSGSIEIKDIRRRRDLYIVVESLDGQKAEARTQIFVETQDYQRKKEKGLVDEEPPTPQPRQPSTNLVSPSSRPQPEPRRRLTPDAESSNINTNILVSIEKSLTNISRVLASQLKLGQRIFDTERRSAEAANRLKKEEQMEGKDEGPSGTSLMKAGAEKMISPFKAIIDKIVNFLVFTFLGRAFTEIIKWMNDPANKGKVDALGKFLKAAWPILLGLSLLFLTPLGSFILGTVQFLTGTAKTLKGLKGLIDRLIFKKGAKPPVKGGPGVAGGTKGKVTVSGQTQARGSFSRRSPISGDVQPTKGFKLPKIPASPLKTIGKGGLATAAVTTILEIFKPQIQGAVGQFYANMGSGMKNLSDEQLIKEIEIESKTKEDPFGRLRLLQEEAERRQKKFSTGGQIFSGLVTEKDGIKVSGAGKDTQAFPVMGGGTAVLQPGEVVLNKAGVKNALSIGIDPLKLNTGPNANKPVNITGGIKAMKSGGIIGGMNRMPTMKKPSMNLNSISNISNKSTNVNVNNNMSMKNSRPMNSSSSYRPIRQSTPMMNNYSSMGTRPIRQSTPMMSNYSSMRSSPTRQSTPMASNYSSTTPRSMSSGISMTRPFTPQTRTYESASPYSRKPEQTSYFSSYDKIARSTSTVYQTSNNFQPIRSTPTLTAPAPLTRRSKSEPIILPPITQNANMVGSSATGSGTQIPSFGATCPSSSAAAARKILCDTYGIIA
jgi:hypothetical protein